MSSSSAPRRPLLMLYPPDGGAARHVIDLASGLEPDAWEIDLACLRDSEPWHELGGRPNVSVHALTGSHGRPVPRDVGDLPLLASLAKRADVVHAHSAKAGFLTRLAAAVVGRSRRTVFTPHGWSFWAATGAEQRLYLALEGVAAHWCRTIITVSEDERSAGLGAAVGRSSQYRVIPNGIDVGRFAAAPRPEPETILWVGRLVPQKQPGLAIEALRMLKRTRPDARLDLVGDGPLLGHVQARLGAADVQGAVRLLGLRDDAPEFLSRAACFLLTSDYEGCPLSVLEAMAAGVPVVATAVGGVPELVGHGETGILVEPGRPEGLARGLDELLSDPARAEALGRAGRQRAKERFRARAWLPRRWPFMRKSAPGQASGELPTSRDSHEGSLRMREGPIAWGHAPNSCDPQRQGQAAPRPRSALMHRCDCAGELLTGRSERKPVRADDECVAHLHGLLRLRARRRLAVQLRDPPFLGS